MRPVQREAQRRSKRKAVAVVSSWKYRIIACTSFDSRLSPFVGKPASLLTLRYMYHGTAILVVRVKLGRDSHTML